MSISLRAGRCVGLGSRFASPSTSAAMFSLTWPPSEFQKRTSPPVHHSAAIEHWTPRNNVEKIARLGTTVMRTLRCSFWGNAPIGKEPSTGKASEMKRVRSRRIGRPRRSVQKRPRVRRKDLPTVKLPGLSRGGGGKTKADEPSRRRYPPHDQLRVLSRNRDAVGRGDPGAAMPLDAMGARTVQDLPAARSEGRGGSRSP